MTFCVWVFDCESALALASHRLDGRGGRRHMGMASMFLPRWCKGFRLWCAGVRCGGWGIVPGWR